MKKYINIKNIIVDVYDKIKLWDNKEVQYSVLEAISLLDEGKIRVAYHYEDKWIVNEWIKKSILMFFYISKIKTINFGPLEFYDKIPIKNNYKVNNIRVVPHAIARYGSYISDNVVLMPSYINIGAYIGTSTMIDTWTTVGSGAQIGSNVHLSGGVGIGGVLEPIQSAPVIIEDNVFIGSRCIIVEGVIIEKEAVLGANVVLTSTTKIIDITHKNPIEMRGRVPSRSVVIPGSYPKYFPAGKYHVPCALIIGKRKESTDKKTTLNMVLREYSLSV
jgi:2,3,4,5-tetrahydropyridine-2-carboxylate N-succinyltransferase